MLPEETFSPIAQRLVESIGKPATNEDVTIYERVRRIEDESYELRTIVASWEKQQSDERDLRNRYAKWLVIALFIQVAIINIAFFLIGFGFLTVEKWVASSFIVGVFVEVTGMTFVVMRYLFPTQHGARMPSELRRAGLRDVPAYELDERGAGDE